MFFSDQYQTFGCMEDEISLSCSSGRYINVTIAYYGMTPLNCTDECCSPNPSDCKEVVCFYWVVDN